MKNKFVLSLLLLIPCVSTSALAFSWEDLWFRPDQQGQKALAKGDAEKAATLFQSKEWQATALYRAQQYKNAAVSLEHLDNPLDNYNRGNALAMMGDYENAIKAYEKTIKEEPGFEDAIYNRDLLKKLMDEKNKQDESKDQPQDKQQDQSKDQQQDKKPDQSKDQQQDKQQDQSKVQQQDKQPDQPKDQQQDKQPDQSKDQQQDKQQNEPKDQQQDQQQNPSLQAKTEQQKATEQWLKRIPDDPGGLLRQKFLRDHQRYQANQGNIIDE